MSEVCEMYESSAGAVIEGASYYLLWCSACFIMGGTLSVGHVASWFGWHISCDGPLDAVIYFLISGITTPVASISFLVNVVWEFLGLGFQLIQYLIF